MCLCDDPWISGPIIVFLVANLFAALCCGIDYEESLWKIINKNGLRHLTLGGWILMILTTPASIIYYFVVYFFKFAMYILSWKPVKEPRIR
jgi:hypothetical protein